MFTSIAQIKCLLTPCDIKELKWGFFVNWKGGKGNNIEDDLAQEISNHVSKSIVQRMGPNKTIQSISKLSKATNGIQEIVEQFDKSGQIHKSSVQHITRESLNDEKEMVEDLVCLDPFPQVLEISRERFPNIKNYRLRYLNVVEFLQCVVKHKRVIKRKVIECPGFGLR